MPDPPEETRARLATPLRVLLALMLVPALVLVAKHLFPLGPNLTPQEAIAPLRDAALRIVQSGEAARQDGGVYAVDVCQLAAFAARSGDRELYDPLRRIILDKLLVKRIPGDPAHGMVAWRHMPDPPHHDASGTTEALRAAEALWAGVRAFGLDEDRDAVRTIVDAYVQHGVYEGETWMIRNYFNLHPEVYSYITNSFLVDYDPDLLAELAQEFANEDWSKTARLSSELIDKAQTPAGLLHQMIRPEIATVMPHYTDGIYSANGVEQLSNVLTVAERCVTTNPDVSQRVLDFCKKRLHHLRLYYHADTGRRLRGAQDTWGGTETWGPLLRLSVKLDEPLVQRFAEKKLVYLSSGFSGYDGDARLYLLGEALLALQYAVEANRERKPVP